MSEPGSESSKGNLQFQMEPFWSREWSTCRIKKFIIQNHCGLPACCSHIMQKFDLTQPGRYSAHNIFSPQKRTRWDILLIQAVWISGPLLWKLFWADCFLSDFSQNIFVSKTVDFVKVGKCWQARVVTLGCERTIRSGLNDWNSTLRLPFA